MLHFAEDVCRLLKIRELVLSTSGLQAASLGLYRSSDYVHRREKVAEAASNKTVGGGICGTTSANGSEGPPGALANSSMMVRCNAQLMPLVLQ
jgi:hypothetical protein